MSTTSIGPVAVVSGTPALLPVAGGFVTGAGTTNYKLNFDVGSFAGTTLTVALEVAWDGTNYTPYTSVSYRGPATAWINPRTGNPVTAIGPQAQILPSDGYPPATSATRHRWRLTANGAFASTGGSDVTS